jgi:hypothetical protein
MPDPSNVQITAPAGLYRNGTVYQSKGKWYDGSLVRFQQDQVKPVGGWQLRSPNQTPFNGKGRAIHTWRDLSGNGWVAVGTSQGLFVQTEDGVSHDITPAGLTAGLDDATRNLGYGGSTYGGGYYGVPPPATTPYVPATVWSLDNFGENLVACSSADGKIYQWTLNVATPAQLVANAPTGCAGLRVTQEGFLFALGADGDGRSLAWCDQQNLTDWTPSTANQAGDFELSGPGVLRCAITVRGGVLLFTDSNCWLVTYIGSPLVYGFERVGQGCGVIAVGAVAAHDSMAAWMAKDAVFFLFDGQSVQPLDCDVLDYVATLNVSQQSKVSAIHLASQGEVWWMFPSASSIEIDSYVCWAYRESQRLGRNVWSFGKLPRLCGDNRGVFINPLMVCNNNRLWEHETGIYRQGATPYLETGPFEIGQGDFMAEVQRVVPDQTTDGQLQANFFLRMWPNGPETALPSVSLVSPTDQLFQATEIRTRYSGDGTWRLGNVRLDIIQGDRADSGPDLQVFYLDVSLMDGSDVLT